MSQRFEPLASPRVRSLLRRGRGHLVQMDAIDHAHGRATPAEGPLELHLRTAAWVLGVLQACSGLGRWSWPFSPGHRVVSPDEEGQRTGGLVPPARCEGGHGNRPASTAE